jgi:hypothetical protein
VVAEDSLLVVAINVTQAPNDKQPERANDFDTARVGI